MPGWRWTTGRISGFASVFGGGGAVDKDAGAEPDAYVEVDHRADLRFRIRFCGRASEAGEVFQRL